MREYFCKHQDTMIVINRGNEPLSRCVNRTSQFYLMPLEPILCENCLVRDTPTSEEKELHEAQLQSMLESLSESVPELISESAPKTPGLGKRIVSYASAVMRWTAAGSPQRTDEEVQRLFVICQACSWHDPASGICKGCGCLLGPEGTAVRSKLRMATEHCPRKLW